MKFFSFEIFFIVSFFVLDFTCGDNQSEDACNDCADVVDFKNIKWALKQAKCDEKVNLKGLKSGAKIVRSLVCKCNHKCRYEPKSNECVQLYHKKIIIQLVQSGFPEIIEVIDKKLSECSTPRKDICEAIQIVIDNAANVFSSCIAGALAYQGDHVKGKAVEFHVDTCYNTTIKQIQDDITAFDKKVPGTKDKILAAVTKGYTPAREVYYGKKFRKCFSEFSGQYSEFCECDSQ